MPSSVADLLVVGCFALALATALATWLLLRRARREREEANRVLQRMWRLGRQIAAELDPQRVLDLFLEAVGDIVRADGAVVAMLTEDGRLRIETGAGVGREWVGHTLPIAGSMSGSVIRTGERLVIADLAAYRGEHDHPSFARFIAAGLSGLAMIPVVRRGERIGVVTVASRAPRAFTAIELDHVSTMADLLPVALENAQLVETLRRAEWRFRTLFRSAPDSVLTVLQSGRIREANDAVREVTGFDPMQVVGREIGELVAEGDRPALVAALATAFAGAPARLEVAMRHQATAQRHRVALAMARLPEADPPSVLVVGRDVTTEREMRVRLMESDRLAAVGELVAGVAHEVNNPLSSISAFAQLLLREPGLTAAQRDSVEVIRSETMRASQVVRDLLAFARRSEPQREPIDVNAVVVRTLRLRAYECASTSVTVEQALDPDLPAVMADARQLQQVCLNLVTNAIQAMAPQGGGVLGVSTRVDDGMVVLEMRDSGPGIADEVRARIFEPFFTTKGEGEGTGLGLSVSYGIVVAHGGRIEVAESSREGTLFRVVLPAAPDALAADSPPAQAHGASGHALRIRPSLAGLRLLFVDDEPALRAGVESFGAQRGFTVHAARDGHEALAAIREHPIDAVVCDLRMPGLDGIAFHDRLRRERPGLAARTVFVTGDVLGSSTRRTAAIRQPVLTKPFALERLEDVLVALLRVTGAGSGMGPAMIQGGGPAGVLGGT